MPEAQDKLAEFAEATTRGGQNIWLYFGSHEQLVRDVARQSDWPGLMFAKTVDEEDLLVEVASLVAVKAVDRQASG